MSIPSITPRELKHQLQDSGARAIVLVSNFTSILEKVFSETPLEHISVTQLGDAFTFPKSAVVDFTVRYLKKRLPAWKLPGHITWRQALKTGRSLLYQRPETGPEDIAFLQYTGGTTGVAKGTILTHRNTIANIEQIRAVYGGLLTDGEEKMVTALPLYHIFALTVNCLFFTEIGGCNLLVTNPYDITALAKSLKHYPFTVIAGVNTLFKSLLNNKTFSALDF